VLYTRYNDHHFHYGYFLYAAAVMVRSNSSLLAKSPSMELAIESLLRDIANPGAAGFDGFGDKNDLSKHILT
jgi:endoglucanase Acf2